MDERNRIRFGVAEEYEHKAIRVKATRWANHGDHADVIVPWDAYRQLHGDPFIQTQDGRRPVDPGDVIVEWPNGSVFVYSSRVFGELFRPVGEAAAPPDYSHVKTAMACVAHMIRDAARKAVDSRLAVDDEAFDRLIGVFNLPDDEMYDTVVRMVETPVNATS